jgi:hypothetical protein
MGDCLITKPIPKDLEEKINKQINDSLTKLGLNDFLEIINKNPDLQKQITETINSLDETCSIKKSGGKRKHHKKMKGGMFLIPSSLKTVFSPLFEQFLDDTVRNPNALTNLRTNIQDIVTNLKRGTVNKIGDVSALLIATILLKLIIYLSACYQSYIYAPPILDKIPMFAQDIIQKIIYNEQRCLSTVPNWFESACYSADSRMLYGLRYILFKMFLLLNFTNISVITALASGIASPEGKIDVFSITNFLINMGNLTQLPDMIKSIVGRMIGLTTPEERQQIRVMAQEIIQQQQIENPEIQINEQEFNDYLQNDMDGGFKLHKKKYKKYKKIKKTKRRRYTNKIRRRRTYRR